MVCVVPAAKNVMPSRLNWVTVSPVLLPVSISLSLASKPVAAFTFNVVSSGLVLVSSTGLGASFTGLTVNVSVLVAVSAAGEPLSETV